MKIPEEIKVVRSGGSATVYIDGEEFPWPILRNGVAVEVSSDEIPTLTLTIVADNVLVENRVT